MKRILIAVLLVLCSDTFAAKRILLDAGDEFIAYAETDTIQNFDNVSRMWVLYDYKFKHTYLNWTYWSQRSLSEFDCAGRRSQTLQYTFYEGQMGGGGMILSGAILPGLWTPIHAGSVLEKFWKIACNK
jgi:hypothetical protein